MATKGILGSYQIYAFVPQAIYVCGKTEASVITLNVCNRNSISVTVRIAISISQTSPLAEEWIEYDVAIPANGYLERSSIFVPPGYYLVIRSSSNNVTAMCWGFEQGDNYSVTPVSVQIGSEPIWTTPSGALADTLAGGDSYNVSLSASDPDGAPLTYSITDGSLPTGLSLSSNGVISGATSTSGYVSGGSVLSSFEITATDGLRSVPRSFSITKRWADGSSSTLAASSAYAIKNLTGTSTSGLYWIKMAGGVNRQVYCDMLNDGGGWMRIYNGANTTGVQLAGNSLAAGDPATGRGKYSDIDITYLISNSLHNTSLHTNKVARMRASSSVDWFFIPNNSIWDSTRNAGTALFDRGWNTYAEFLSSPNSPLYSGSNLAGNYTYGILASYNVWGNSMIAPMSPSRDIWFTGSTDSNDSEIYLR